MSSRPMMASVAIATNIVTGGVMMMITSKLNPMYNNVRMVEVARVIALATLVYKNRLGDTI